MIKIILISNDTPLHKNDFEKLLELVSCEKKERIQRFHFYKDASHTLIGDVLARHMISHVTGLHNSELHFSSNHFGKPFLENNVPIHFNISHSGRYIACAISDAAVGIDIEQIKPIDMKIAKRFFSADEIAYILADDHEPLKIKRFYEIWTKKESRIKWEGMGLSKALDSFSVLKEDSTVLYHPVLDAPDAVGFLCTGKNEKPIIEMMDVGILIPLR